MTTKKKLHLTLDHLSDAECRKMLQEMVDCVRAVGQLSSVDAISELVSACKEHGVEWDGDRVPESD